MRFRKEGFVSLWLCQEKPKDTNYDPLKSDFGIDYYSLDNLEPAGSNDGTLHTVEDLIKQLSYAKSFAEASIARARELKISKACLVIALFDFAYDPSKLNIDTPDDPSFLGVFEWNDDES